MQTGLYPLRHGVRKNVHWALSPDAHTLPEAARAAGNDTGAFLAAAV
jgi:arylsulfatase A-like enzyme